jgi:hypothetical protein
MAETIEQRFRRLADAWRSVAPSHPRNPVRYDHPIYQEIVGLGPAVVPHLLRALQEYPRDWFWALHVITGADPIAPEEQGDFSAMREAWLRWGRKHGFLGQSQDGSGQKADGTQELAASSRMLAGPPEGHLPALEDKFRQLATIWRAETCYLSSTTAMVNHPAYQEIIALGPAVVPLVLQELERQPAQWFTALQTLTGANPMNPADQGKVRQIAESWLRWGKANGYRW